MQEKISELLDDELEPQEQEQVLRSISQNAEWAAIWQRYHIIRAVVRSESIAHIPGFSERVQVALDNKAKTPFKRQQPRGIFSTQTNKWAPGLALAASLAGLAVFGFFQLQPGEEVAGGFNRTGIAQIDQRTKWETSTPDLEQTLNAYLVEHGEFTPMSSMNGLMAYAKFVSYDSAE